MKPNFKVYFSKSSRLPCVEWNEKLIKARNLEVDVPTKGQWEPHGQSPSWVIVGEANIVIHDPNTDTISIS